jgi:hypothetical protein
MQSWRLLPTFRINVLSPSSGSNTKTDKELARNNQQADCNCLTLTACLIYPSTLKMETVHFSETLENFCRTSWCHIPGSCKTLFGIELKNKMQNYLKTIATFAFLTGMPLLDSSLTVTSSTWHHHREIHFASKLTTNKQRIPGGRQPGS